MRKITFGLSLDFWSPTTSAAVAGVDLRERAVLMDGYVAPDHLGSLGGRPRPGGQQGVEQQRQREAGRPVPEAPGASLRRPPVGHAIPVSPYPG